MRPVNSWRLHRQAKHTIQPWPQCNLMAVTKQNLRLPTQGSIFVTMRILFPQNDGRKIPLKIETVLRFLNVCVFTPHAPRQNYSSKMPSCSLSACKRRSFWHTAHKQNTQNSRMPQCNLRQNAAMLCAKKFACPLLPPTGTLHRQTKKASFHSPLIYV